MNWEQQKEQLKRAPHNYRRKKAHEKFFKIQKVGEWKSGGFAPWQAFLPVRFKGVNYTLYLRERHNSLSLKVMWGHDGFRPQPKYHGFLGFVNLLDEDAFERLDKGEDLYELAEEIGIEYLEDLKGFLPKNDEDLK